MTLLSKIISSAAIAFLIFGLVLPLKIYAGYAITDKDGKVISEEPGNALVTGPTNQTIILNDRGNHKVFEIFWDAQDRAVVVIGDNVHLKIFSSGRVEKWTGFESDNNAYPIFIQPVVPIVPPRR